MKNLLDQMTKEGRAELLEMEKTKPHEWYLLHSDMARKSSVEELKFTSMLIILMDIGLKKFYSWFE
jgi:hypothetical protein